VLTGDAIHLTPLSHRHVEATRMWANDPVLMTLMDRAQAVEEAEHKSWFQALQNRSDCRYFAIETNDEARHVGNVWLWAVDLRHRKAELRIVIGDAPHHGKGWGTQAIELACLFAFQELKLHKVYAYVLSLNPRALRAFEKAGFIVEGTLKADRWVGDRFVDVYVLGKLNG
jgi:RimJ/RimL family protein N-acetyltransferase